MIHLQKVYVRFIYIFYWGSFSKAKLVLLNRFIKLICVSLSAIALQHYDRLLFLHSPGHDSARLKDKLSHQFSLKIYPWALLTSLLALNALLGI